MMESVKEILEYESKYLDMLKSRLKRLKMATDGNPPMEELADRIEDAYLSAVESMYELKANIDKTYSENAVASHTEEVEAVAPILAQRRNLVGMGFALGFCGNVKFRPSFLFQQEMSQVIAEVLNKYQVMLVSSEADDRDLAQYIDNVGKLVCGFGLPSTDALQGREDQPMWKRALKALGWGVAGWIANDVWRGDSFLLSGKEEATSTP